LIKVVDDRRLVEVKVDAKCQGEEGEGRLTWSKTNVLDEG
jgi:hypothetical protein